MNELAEFEGSLFPDSSSLACASRSCIRISSRVSRETEYGSFAESTDFTGSGDTDAP